MAGSASQHLAAQFAFGRLAWEQRYHHSPQGICHLRGYPAGAWSGRQCWGQWLVPFRAGAAVGSGLYCGFGSLGRVQMLVRMLLRSQWIVDMISDKVFRVFATFGRLLLLLIFLGDGYF